MGSESIISGKVIAADSIMLDGLDRSDERPELCTLRPALGSTISGKYLSPEFGNRSKLFPSLLRSSSVDFPTRERN